MCNCNLRAFFVLLSLPRSDAVNRKRASSEVVRSNNGRLLTGVCAHRRDEGKALLALAELPLTFGPQIKLWHATGHAGAQQLFSNAKFSKSRILCNFN